MSASAHDGKAESIFAEAIERSAEDRDESRIYQLNFQFFPLTQVVLKK